MCICDKSAHPGALMTVQIQQVNYNNWPKLVRWNTRHQVSLVLCQLLVVKWTDSISCTRLWFCVEMKVVVSTSVECGAIVLEKNSLSGARCYVLVAQLRGLWVAVLFHLPLCSFCSLTALFPKGTVFLWITFCVVFVPRIYFLSSLRTISERRYLGFSFPSKHLFFYVRAA